MLVQWYADLDGDESKTVPRLMDIVTDVGRRHGFRLLGGPYHPQQNSLLLLLEADSVEAFQKSGKETLERLAREGVPVTPMRYDLAFKCGEFGGP